MSTVDVFEKKARIIAFKQNIGVPTNNYYGVHNILWIALINSGKVIYSDAILEIINNIICYN